MKRRIICLLSYIMLCLKGASGNTEEPDWALRYETLKREAMNEFVGPKIGDTITVTRRVGGDVRGKIEAISADSIRIDGKNISALSLTPASCANMFASYYAVPRATDRLHREKEQYLALKSEEVLQAQKEQIVRDEIARKNREIAHMNEQTRRLEENNRLAVEQARIKEEEKTRLDFKGLRLGMTHEDVENLIKLEEWGYKFQHDRGSRDNSLFLGIGGKASQEFRTIGSKGPEGHKSLYYWDYAQALFYQGRIYAISVSSGDWSADLIDSRLKDWLRMSLEALTNKYGPPSETLLTVDDVNIFSFKSNRDSYLYIWIVNNQQVSLTITTYKAEYSGRIFYVDLNTARKMENESTTKTSL